MGKTYELYSPYQRTIDNLKRKNRGYAKMNKDITNQNRKLNKENRKLKKQLDCALKLLAEMFPPCERDGFMDKHSDYCQLNCGVDKEVFKKCWLMYIEDKLKEVE